MANSDKPDISKLKPQAQALLKGFFNAGAFGLTTRQLLNFSYSEEGRDGELHSRMIGDWRARKSDLKKLGFVFTKTHIPGSDQFIYKLVGYNPDQQLPLQLTEAAA